MLMWVVTLCPWCDSATTIDCMKYIDMIDVCFVPYVSVGHCAVVL